MKKHIIFEKEFKITDDIIDKFEKMQNIILPMDYRSHLLNYNGGKFEPDTYSVIQLINGNEEFAGVDYIYSICNDDNTSLEKNMEIYYGRVPRDLIPIAENGCGDQICLGISGDRYGKVYFWDHNFEFEEPYDNISLIANSFEDFINKLYKFDIVDYGEVGERYRSTYDHYALPTSHYIRHYKEGVILDFFAQAPKGTEDFVIDEYKESGELVLFFDNKNAGVRKKRILYKDSSFEDLEEAI